MTWRLEEFGHIDSTQEIVKRRLSAGQSVDRLLVRARVQSAGRGRRGATFRSEAGGSYQTFALADPFGVGSGAGITLAIGVCLAEALREAGVKAAVKWPNDLYYLNRKLGGVLVERTKGHLLIGVGVNVENDVPRGAIALRSWPLAAVHEVVMRGVDDALSLLTAEDGALSDEIRRRYALVDWLAGKTVTVGSFDPFTALSEADELPAGGRSRVASGVVLGIDQVGCLLLGRDPVPGTAPTTDPGTPFESKVWKLERVCSGTVLTIG